MALSVENLSCGYGDVPVLHSVSLTVNDNEAVAIVGANGAGKSTLVRAVAGLSVPMAGAVRMNGVDVTGVPSYRRQEHGIAVVLEERNLFSEMTVLDNLRLSERAGLNALKTRGGNGIKMADVLDLFPVVAERLHSRVELLSGGGSNRWWPWRARSCFNRTCWYLMS
ncbi:ATP-binding cassette domain-containing protein [Ensifer adhaerens]|uniref:ATP-binding cassette domain-containing protein n=1 Tax=Ensifer adhaerens TaxID=106592 RepID=UPI0019D4DA21|nr:ATP-binding cassette domain-containing protein [Ensifer adhaerens]MDF8357669.1 ATP-binding cassette domain-containing protein [Ensifer adhaerens]